MPFDLADAALIATAFLLAGLVKGLAGFGLPAVSLGLLVLTRPLPDAMALMLVPALATNMWQALAGPALAEALRRLWPFLLAAALGALGGVGVLARADAATLSGLLGLLLLAGSALALAGLPMPSPGARREAWLSPLMGALSGLVCGATGSFLMPAAPYFAALRLPPGVFIQGFGLGVLAAMLPMGLGMAGAGLLPVELGLASLAGVVPAFLGLAAGQALRRRLAEARFRQLVQAALGALGLYLAIRGLG